MWKSLPCDHRTLLQGQKRKNGLHAYCKRCAIKLEQSRQGGVVDKVRALPKSRLGDGQKQCSHFAVPLL
jgi:hypothetical protein